MESEARIMIDSKKGIIEIEGPLRFVEKYMARYALGSKTPEEVVKPPELKPRSSKKTCLKTVRILIKEGFFVQSRSFTDIRAKFMNMDDSCSDGSLRNALKEIVKKRKLSVSGAGRGTRYVQQVTETQPIPNEETSEIDIPL